MATKINKRINYVINGYEIIPEEENKSVEFKINSYTFYEELNGAYGTINFNVIIDGKNEGKLKIAAGEHHVWNTYVNCFNLNATINAFKEHYTN